MLINVIFTKTLEFSVSCYLFVIGWRGGSFALAKSLRSPIVHGV